MRWGQKYAVWNNFFVRFRKNSNFVTMRKILWMLAAILTLSSCMISFSSCSPGQGKAEGIALVAGTLDGPLGVNAPDSVLEILNKAQRFHSYEIMSDTASNICVEAIGEADTTSTQGYGMVVVKNATSTTFPHLRNVRQPQAVYDGEQDLLWLTCSAMEGTGVAVEMLYQIKFDTEDKAYIACTVEPYDIQQQLCSRLGFTIQGQEITLWDGAREIATATNTVTDMGGFDSETPVWIGESLVYQFSGTTPVLALTPGVNFTTGLVLTYDDMPTLTAPLTLNEDGTVSLGELSVLP